MPVWLAVGWCLLSAGYADAQQRTLFPQPKYRSLVEGVERTLRPERDFFELSSRHDLTELLQADANFNWAKDVTFRHDIWAYEFTFKPIRLLDVDLPGPNGKLQKKRIWYMAYRINNPGLIYRLKPTVYEARPEITPEHEELVADRNVDPVKRSFLPGEVEVVKEEDFVKELVEKYAAEKGIGADQVDLDDAGLQLRLPRFVPTFLLYSIDTGGKTYLDRILPGATPTIQQREDVNRPLLNTVAISGRLPAAKEGEDNSVWGVVTWEDVDPQTDYFSIYIQGLTNAYRWEDTPNGRWFARKTLRLDFWRPGDEFDEQESEIRFLRSGWYWLDATWASRPREE